MFYTWFDLLKLRIRRDYKSLETNDAGLQILRSGNEILNLVASQDSQLRERSERSHDCAMTELGGVE